MIKSLFRRVKLSDRFLVGGNLLQFGTRKHKTVRYFFREQHALCSKSYDIGLIYDGIST